MRETFDDRWDKFHEDFDRQERTVRRLAWIAVPLWIAFYGAIIVAMWIGVKWLLENVV